jgi:hypothetical protein
MPRAVGPQQYHGGVRRYAKLFAAVEALGGSTPSSCRAALDSMDAYQAASSASYVGASPLDNIVRAAKRGEPLSREEADRHIREAARAKLIEHHGLDMRLDQPVGQLLRDLVAGEAGDELIGSLQPVVARAIDGILACVEAGIGPDTTPEQILELEPEAAAAYKAARLEHAPLLDRVLNEVLRPTTVPAELELFPAHLWPDYGQLLLASWFMPLDRAVGTGGYDGLVQVASILNRQVTPPEGAMGGTGGYVPGQRWLEIHQLCGLRLNTPRQAVAVLDRFYDQQQAEYSERYASQTAGPDGEPMSPPRKRRYSDHRTEPSAAERAQQRMQGGVDPDGASDFRPHPGVVDTEELQVPVGPDIGYSEELTGPPAGARR